MPRLLHLAATIVAATLCVSAAAANKNSVSIGDMSFNPSSIDVKVGDTVEWTNNDVREHNVTAKDGSFGSSNLGPGKSYRQTFKKAGKFSYGCSLHPRMKGTINVSQ